MEPRQSVFGNQLPLQELMKDGAQMPVHHQLGNEQQRQNHQELGMNLRIF